MILLCACFLLLCLVGADEDIVTNLCAPGKTFPAVMRREPTFVCVNVNNHFRAVFRPKADQFSVISIADSWNDTRIGGNESGAFLSVSSLGNHSAYKQYAARDKFYPYLTAIISVKKGVVQGVNWDDGCHFCNRSSCENNLFLEPTNTSLRIPGEAYTCFVERSICQESSSACDLALYIGWTGTDGDGDYLSSSGVRLSQFQKYSFTSFYSSIKGKLSALVPMSRYQFN